MDVAADNQVDEAEEEEEEEEGEEGEEATNEVLDVPPSWQGYGLHPLLLKAITELKFEEPTPIQVIIKIYYIFISLEITRNWGWIIG